MVIGAGALGNEVIKNLALLGVGYILVIDFDEIEISNLSRTVLFHQNDLGKSKATVAAQRARELNVEPQAFIDHLHSDVVRDLGLGIYRRMDIIIGCLDNIEARLAVNHSCLLTGKPYIDGGIREMAGSVYIFSPPFNSCFNCTTTTREREEARGRYDSCFQTVRRNYAQGRMATVQVTAAIIAALQVEQAIKWLHQRPMQTDVRIQYDGGGHRPYFDSTPITRRSGCECESAQALPHIKPLAQRSDAFTLSELIDHAKEAGIQNPNIKFPSTFVPHVYCGRCGQNSDIMRPLNRIANEHVECRACLKAGDRRSLQLFHLTDSLDVGEIENEQYHERLMSLTLQQLGFPSLPIVSIQDGKGDFHFYELTCDEKQALPNYQKGTKE